MNYLAVFNHGKDKHLDQINRESIRESNQLDNFILLAMIFVFLAGMIAGSALHDNFFHPFESKPNVNRVEKIK